MSLSKPLVKPLVDGLVKPLVNNDAEIQAAKDALVVKYPLYSSLNGTPSGTATLTRASNEWYKDYRAGSPQWKKIATNAQAATNSTLGTLVQGTVQNKCTNNGNINPVDTTNLTDSVCVTTVISPALYPSDFSQAVIDGDANGKVFESDNSTAGLGSVTIGGTVGNTNTHSEYIIARVTRGTGGYITIGNTSLATITSSEWSVIKAEGFTPAAAGQSMKVFINANSTIEWFANGLYERPSLPLNLVEISGSATTQALTDLSVDSSAFPVNDCAYFFRLNSGINANGGLQMLFESRIDATNYLRIQGDSSGSSISVVKLVGGSAYTAAASYTQDGTSVYGLVKMDSTGGMEVTLSNGGQGDNVNTLDLPVSSTFQIGATNPLTVPFYGYMADFKVFNSSDITLEGARFA